MEKLGNMEEKVMKISIADTEADVHYEMNGKKPHVLRVITRDGRVLSKQSDMYQPSLELMVLVEEGLITNSDLN
jgi:hypothetical protein